MTSALLVELLYCLAFLSVFLLLGTFLRAKVTIFQKTFLPASVIGGFIALILGPIVLGVMPVPETWLKTFSLLPGILIVPIVASVPLGLKISGGAGKNIKNITPIFFIMSIIGALQYVVGFGTNLIFKNSGMDIYKTFGWELSLGFSGGHGTAGLLGNILKSMNLPYWETAQGVAVTTATFGILGGILMGMVLINWAARKGETSILKNPSDIPQNMRVGYEKDVKKQASIGRETTMSSSVDTVAFHSAIIFAACGIAYYILNTIKAYKVPMLSTVSIWAYAIVVMFIIWGIMCKLKLEYLVDSKVKSKIAGTLTEVAIVAAIASLPVQAVMTYIIPILVMVIGGFIVTVVPVMLLTKKYVKVYWFEHAITILGMCTGVFLTGLLLLRICDPELESPVLANYSLAYTINSVINFALLQFFLSVILSDGAAGMLKVSGGLVLLYAVGLVVFSKFGSSDKESVLSKAS